MKEISLPRMTLGLRQEETCDKEVPWKVIVDEVSLERCWGIPTRSNSVLERLTETRFEVNQSNTDTRVEERRDRLEIESEEENEM